MKKMLIPVVGTLGAGVIIISGMSQFGQADNPFSFSPTQAGNAAPGNGSPASAPQVETPGLVSVQYHLYHLDRLASNQIAIWIEDTDGHYVKTLRASSFTANGGYRTRPESLPEWRKAADWAHASENDVQSVSLPEQEPGDHVVYWDCTNADGKPVAPGTYVYKMEGNILWENRVLFTGTITVGNASASTTAKATFMPDGAESEGTLLENVRAGFEPGRSIASVKQEPVTNTRGS